jgi:hypothetical protein
MALAERERNVADHFVRAAILIAVTAVALLRRDAKIDFAKSIAGIDSSLMKSYLRGRPLTRIN